MAATNGLAALRVSVDCLLTDVGGLLADLLEAPQTEDDDDSRRVIDEQLQKFWQGYYDLKRRHDENSLSVAVLALTKSGKSTLLNALLGLEVLPMNNVPETARIVRIAHDASVREPTLQRDPHTGRPVRGEAAIRARLAELNSMARGGGGAAGRAAATGGPRSSGEGEGLTGAAGGGGGAGLLQITAPLMALEGFGPELGRVTLLDTPGPNEAGEEQLRHQVERLLEGVDCVLYLLDYTKLKTADEEALFKRLRTVNPQLVARLSSRLFFIINKVDACETSEGLDPDEVREYVSELVTRQLGGAAPPPPAPAPPAPAPAAGPAATPPDSPATGSFSRASSGSGVGVAAAATPFRLRPEQVVLVSARNALLARLVLAGRAGPEALRRFTRLAFGAFGGGGFGRAGPTNEQIRCAAASLLESSGLPELEGRVLTFLAAHAASVKLLATVDDSVRLLGQVRNVAAACAACLRANAAALATEAAGLRGELAEATAAVEGVRGRADALQREVVAEIKAHLNTLRARLFTHIVQTLDADTRAPPPPPSPAASAAAPAASRWARVREKFLSMFTSTLMPPSPPSPSPHAAGSCGGGGCGGGGGMAAARSRSREELTALLEDLHDDLMGQIHAEVADFWGMLEAVTASRHTELMAALNTQLAALAGRVEGAVAGRLHVELAPADISLRPPSAEQLHSDVRELINKGIRESTEKHIRVGSRSTTERVLRQPAGPPSLCRWGGYYVEVPRTRTVVETYTATVFSLRPDEIANHFIGLVDGAVAASERALAAYVGAVIERQLEAARRQVQEYGDRYLGAVQAALDVSSRGAEYRAAALAQVEAYLSRVDALAGRAAEAQAAAEAGVPGGAEGLMDEVEAYEDEEDEEEERQELEQERQGHQQQEGEEEQGEEVEQELEAAAAEAPAALTGDDEDLKQETQAAAVEGVGAVEQAPAGPLLELLSGGSHPEQVVDSPAADALLSGVAEEGTVREVAQAEQAPLAEAHDGDSPFMSASGSERHLAGRDGEADVEAAGALLSSGGGAAGTTGEVLGLMERRIEEGDAQAEAGDEGAEARGGSDTDSACLSSLPDIDAVPAASSVTEGAVAAAAAEEADAPWGEAEGTAAVAVGPEADASDLVASQPEAAAAAPVPVPPARQGSSPPGSASRSSYAALPFDYSRAFLDAMSSSELVPSGGVESGADGDSSGDAEHALDMIPLTSAAAYPAAPGSPGGGSRDGSDEWQLVGEDVSDVSEEEGPARRK